MWRAVVCLSLLAACSFRSGIEPIDAGHEDDAPMGSGTGGGSGSGSGSGGGGSSCAVIGQRVCVDDSHSGACDVSLQPVADRACPTGSTCAAGYCQPPPNSASCNKASDCTAGKVCDLYVVTGTLHGFCTSPVGSGGTYASCESTGDDASCKSGMCARDFDGTQQCLVPCVNASDSTCPGDKDCNALAQPSTIEGIPTGGQFACFD